MPSVADNERNYLVAKLGLNASEASKMSIADLRASFYANPPSGDGGPVTIADLPADSVVTSSTTARPTARTDIMVIFTGPDDPSANMLADDIWLN